MLYAIAVGQINMRYKRTLSQLLYLNKMEQVSKSWIKDLYEDAIFIHTFSFLETLVTEI